MMASKKKTRASKNRSSKKTARKSSARSGVKNKALKATSRVKKARRGKTHGARRVRTSKASPRRAARVFRSSIPTREESGIETVELDVNGRGPKFGGQSGDLQGLSNIEGADSESVGELLEEGNSFEAEVVKGVEDVRDADEGEVRTHQRPQQQELDEDFREN